ncbi:PadR family transcriptional regulator [Paenibacillus sp. TRM 82003]|nr:PadR family transcriptional regulator [Paenibacillus sp. TRM 82003]
MNSQDVILGILMHERKSGYDIKRMFEQYFSMFYNASFGTIYPTLARMEKDGLLTKESLVQTGKPNKNVYTITEAGREAFRRYLASDMQDVEIKSDFMVRLFFGGLAEEAQVRQWFEEGLERARQSYASLQAEFERWKRDLTPTQRVCLKIGLSNQRALIDNLEEALAELKQLEDEKG